MDEAKQRFDQIRELFRTGNLPVEYPEYLTTPVWIDKDLWGDDSSAGNVTKILTKNQRRHRAEIQIEIDSKLRLLFFVYGINDNQQENPDCWKLLAGALFMQHVPGFRQTYSWDEAYPKKAKRGAPDKWTPRSKAELVTEVDFCREQLAKETGREVGTVKPLHAVRRVLKKHRAKWPGKSTEQNLTKRYFEFTAALRKSEQAVLRSAIGIPMTLANLGLIYPPSDK